MGEMRFEIGQFVWWASFESEADYVTCPECGGTKFLRAILFDGTEYQIDCEGCSRGYEGSQGCLQVYKRTPHAKLCRITGVEIREGKTEWGITDSYRVPDSELFTDEAAALECAKAKAAALDAEERARITRKEKDAKSWSWHVHYHRRCIRDAEKSIVYHTAKLNVAKVKAKEPVADDGAPHA